jgi:uncharacterized protein
MLSPVKIWRNQKKIASFIGKTGEVLSWTLIRVPPTDFSSLAPYPVVLVKFTDNTYLTAQMVDWDESDLQFRQKVVTVIRRVSDPNTEGLIPYGIKFKPL